ncbi:protease SohB [Ostreibacterium oceani]|uniref:Protease SohB n=1 Tax=Ostreibacterium oceani TaxID=2654998 RepID=A0A6N7F2N3_9GAMM|nr:protease SohB [Ostreibacterium oceani]MPV86126.1 protease SohB [Ostreibacterium oceani]
MEFLTAYFLFVAKGVTLLVFLLLGLLLVVAIVSRGKKQDKDDREALEVTYLNSELFDDKLQLQADLLDKAERKQIKKSPIKPDKSKSRLFVIDFDGDIYASETSGLRRQITAILQAADKDKDKVLLCLESPGGVVHGYGLAASQLSRLRAAGIPLVVAVDKVAASGGYMMACVADEIVAAPFAVLGSIGVVAQVPNIHRLLKENKVDVELHTAGKYKRTLTLLGENTDEGREKFLAELELTHDLFKSHIHKFRPQIDIDTVATGETWYGQQAIENQLADKLMTSDDYILSAAQEMDIYQLSISHKQGFIEKLKEQFMHKQKAQISDRYFM